MPTQCYKLENERLLPCEQPDDALWIDLLDPAREEETILEAKFGLELPTRADMEEIEVSSRLYEEDGALFMTAVLPAATDEIEPTLGPITFVLTERCLLTIRYHDPRPFRTFPARAAKSPIAGNTPETVFLSLIEAMVDRLADIIERAGRTITPVSRSIFRPDRLETKRNRDYRPFLEVIGRTGDLVSDIRDSLTTLDRAIGYYAQHLVRRSGEDTDALRSRVKTITRDLHSIADHAGFLSSKVTLILEATLGMVSIEQNSIIKIFSVAAVVFLPPTLIASIYGMNFEFMPELHWPVGYPFAVILMILSAVLPYWLFKKNGWL